MRHHQSRITAAATVKVRGVELVRHLRSLATIKLKLNGFNTSPCLPRITKCQRILYLFIVIILIHYHYLCFALSLEVPSGYVTMVSKSVFRPSYEDF